MQLGICFRKSFERANYMDNLCSVLRAVYLEHNEIVILADFILKILINKTTTSHCQRHLNARTYSRWCQAQQQKQMYGTKKKHTIFLTHPRNTKTM